jgi:hypothetical protein
MMHLGKHSCHSDLIWSMLGQEDLFVLFLNCSVLITELRIWLFYENCASNIPHMFASCFKILMKTTLKTWWPGSMFIINPSLSCWNIGAKRSNGALTTFMVILRHISTPCVSHGLAIVTKKVFCWYVSVYVYLFYYVHALSPREDILT